MGCFRRISGVYGCLEGVGRRVRYIYGVYTGITGAHMCMYGYKGKRVNQGCIKGVQRYIK